MLGIEYFGILLYMLKFTNQFMLAEECSHTLMFVQPVEHWSYTKIFLKESNKQILLAYTTSDKL